MSEKIRGPYLRAIGDESVPEPTQTVAAVENADGFVAIEGSTNTADLSDVSPDTKSAYTEATESVRSAMMDRDWVVTQFPAPGDAQAAEMSTEAYREFISNAISLDWDEQVQFQQPLADRLEAASEVHIQSDETDIRFSIDGMPASNGNARVNLPGSEVATAPVPESVKGDALFDLPTPIQGSTVENVHLSFTDGEVDEYTAETGEEILSSVLSTDAGASRLGEFGIGMNRAIEKPTKNTLLDEKMGDTVHLALGQAIPNTVGPDRKGNESAVHEDLLIDMRDTGHIELDSDVIYEDGSFRWEDDFGS